MTQKQKQDAHEVVNLMVQRTIDLVDNMSKEVIKPLIKQGVFSKNGNYDYETVIKLAYEFHEGIKDYYGDFTEEIVLTVINQATQPYFRNELNYIIENNIK